jgi:molybdopterin molybdotransferase
MIRMARTEQALALLREHGLRRLQGVETVPLGASAGRRLAGAAIARTDQPPATMSAMDGYAVRRAEATHGAHLTVLGESRAGAPFPGDLPPGSAVRIFTGAIVPAGADHILIQEEARREGDLVAATQAQTGGASIRRQGRDFASGSTLMQEGQLLTPGAMALLAAGNIGEIPVRMRPRMAVLANGDELVEPGARLGVGQITNSITPALLSLAAHWGAAPRALGISRDDPADVQRRVFSAADADVIVSIGGASVGDHDVVRSAFDAMGFVSIFEKVAVKPGKPTWFAERGSQLVLGLPGNPAAALVTARLFLRPLIEAMMGLDADDPSSVLHARLESRIDATGNREEYLRARLTIGADGAAWVELAEDQDSSLVHPFLRANALVRRTAGSPAAEAGELVECIALDAGFG